ncbi:MAG: molybdenum cofactor guanylyltransferase [Nitrospirota bacterium]
MEALILAGGDNRRLHIIKGLIEIHGKRIIESNIEILKRMFKRVIISTNNPEIYFYTGALIIGDIIKYKGPMTGIFSALSNIAFSDIFVIACDMPFINPKLIRYIIDNWDEKWDAVIPIFDKKPQPLFGIYSKKIAESMERSIKGGRRSLRGFLEEIKVLYITEKEVRNIDPEGKSFVNINTLEDFKKEIGGQICLV